MKDLINLNCWEGVHCNMELNATLAFAQPLDNTDVKKELTEYSESENAPFQEEKSAQEA